MKIKSMIPYAVLALALTVPSQAFATPNTSSEMSIMTTNQPGVTYVQPENNFDPLNASQEELQQHHFPSRPSDPKKLEQWTEAMKHAKTFVKPEFSVQEGVTSSITNSNSSNWAGYINGDPSHGFTYVMAEWNISSVLDSTQTSYSCQWIGIGGDGTYVTNGQLIQTGTESDYINGSYKYYFWYEQLNNQNQNPQVKITSLTAHPSDLVYASISYSGGNANYWVEDMTTSTYSSFTISNSSQYYDGGTAEYIVERTRINGVLPALANFNTAAFGYCTATNNTNTYSPGQWSTSHTTKDSQMVNGSTVLATPGSLYTTNSTNDSFTVTWKRYQ